MRLVELAEGRGDDTPLPVPQSARLCEAIDLEFPIARLEPLAFVVQGLLSRLLARLEARALACGELALHLALEGGGRDDRRIGLAAPTTDLRTLVRLVHRALEAHAPAAAVVGARVEAEGQPTLRDQLDLFRPAGPAPAALGHTLAELEALYGAGRVGTPAVADDHRPGLFTLSRFHPGRASPARAPSHSTPLAVCALRPPVPAQVTAGSGGPAWVRSAVASGRVVHVAGPWRTTGGWWSAEERFAYDYFDVQTSDGTLARLRYDHVARLWAIDAIYD
jgi:protein ImuB